MIAVDTNILVYAHRKDVAFHPRALDVVRECAERMSAWAIPWSCIHEFFGVVTNPRIFRRPSTSEEACAQIDAWTGSPRVVLLAEQPGYWDLFALAAGVARGGARVHDARIAALCLQHGVDELWTADRDFSRFEALATRNPLV